MQIDKIDYSNHIYKLLHPNLRFFSESGGFTENKKIRDDVREGGFLKMISNLLADVFFKQKIKIDEISKMHSFSEFSSMNDAEIIDFENLDFSLGEILFDEEYGGFYFYFFNKSILSSSELFNSSWVLYDDFILTGVSHSRIDMIKTEDMNDTNYYYRLYINGDSISLKKRYLLLKPSFFYNLAKNKSIPVHLLNSSRVNVSLLKNAYKFFINKSGASNIKEVAQSLEAELKLESYTVIAKEYKEAIIAYKTELLAKILASGGVSETNAERIVSTLFIDYTKGTGETKIDRTLVKGIVFATRFEDFRIDYLKEWQSLIVVRDDDVFNIIEGMNGDIVIKDIVITNNTLYNDYNFDSSGNLTIHVDKNDTESIFFKRIGEPTRWFLEVKNGSRSFVYSMESISLGSEIVMEFKPFFNDIANYRYGISLYDTISANFSHPTMFESKIYYEYFYYKPVSYASNLVYLSLKNEINSSALKTNFNLYKYNKKVIDIFMPDYYEVMRGYVEFNGERTLF